MKKYLAVLGVFAALLAFTAPVQATYLTYGDVDHLIAGTNLGNSGDPTVLDWVNDTLSDYLGYAVNVTLDQQDSVLASQWTMLDPGVYAHLLSLDPAFFLVKVALGDPVTGVDGDTHFLFQNLDSLAYAVVNLQQMGFVSVTNIGGISHIDQFASQVPEPGTLLLLGSGLLGLGLMRRRRN